MRGRGEGGDVRGDVRGQEGRGGEGRARAMWRRWYTMM